MKVEELGQALKELGIDFSDEDIAKAIKEDAKAKMKADSETEPEPSGEGEDEGEMSYEDMKKAYKAASKKIEELEAASKKPVKEEVDMEKAVADAISGALADVNETLLALKGEIEQIKRTPVAPKSVGISMSTIVEKAQSEGIVKGGKTHLSRSLHKERIEGLLFDLYKAESGSNKDSLYVSMANLQVGSPLTQIATNLLIEKGYEVVE